MVLGLIGGGVLSGAGGAAASLGLQLALRPVVGDRHPGEHRRVEAIPACCPLRRHLLWPRVADVREWFSPHFFRPLFRTSRQSSLRQMGRFCGAKHCLRVCAIIRQYWRYCFAEADQFNPRWLPGDTGKRPVTCGPAMIHRAATLCHDSATPFGAPRIALPISLITSVAAACTMDGIACAVRGASGFGAFRPFFHFGRAPSKLAVPNFECRTLGAISRSNAATAWAAVQRTSGTCRTADWTHWRPACCAPRPSFPWSPSVSAPGGRG